MQSPACARGTGLAIKYSAERAPHKDAGVLLLRIFDDCSCRTGMRRGLQSPEPGFALKCFSYLSGTSFHWSASPGASFLRVIFGQASAYCRLISSHFPAAYTSVTGLIAPTGNSGSPPPQPTAASGWLTRMFR